MYYRLAEVREVKVHTRKETFFRPALRLDGIDILLELRYILQPIVTPLEDGRSENRLDLRFLGLRIIR